MGVILYSTGCVHCTILEKGLEKKGVKYELINDEDEILKRGITSIPVLEVDGKRMDYPTAYNYIRNFEKQGD